MKSVLFENAAVTPSKVVCVGRNYVAHIRELGNEMPEKMVLFCKPNSAISDRLRYFTPDTRFEGEICLLMGEGRIAGVGFGFDLTHAHIQNDLKRKGLPWERAKAFDGSAVFSPFVRVPENLSGIGFRLWRNGTLAQEGDYSLMIYKPETIVEEIRTFMTLKKGDIVMTGTPKGVCSYEAGDRFRAELFDADGILLQKEWSVEA
ncbi:fumarylacetoacetate hydrolase family protein [Hydrogenimonas sp. SS33]|uniref:fumarylacetoacetate hydrolase family protein n=1 Tax=Hydrogenimonas leucolamina TaxID=2954236 RepID=UPI00336BF8A2